MEIKPISVFVTLPPYTTEYAILCDRPAEFIHDFARAHPKCFVFPFSTKTVSEVPDYNSLRDDPTLDHVLRPYYVGNLNPPDRAIQRIVETIIRDWHPVRCLADETPEEDWPRYFRANDFAFMHWRDGAGFSEGAD
jgi:hypothetical protein